MSDESSFISDVSNGSTMEPEENLLEGMWKQYEQVVMRSIITSFGLDFFIKDQYGGDVDTIHNVRQIGQDSAMKYKSDKNALDYANEPQYDSAAYHSDSRYREIVQKADKEFKEKGIWQDDVYVAGHKVAPNKSVPREKQGQLDHVVSAKEIHEDRGRILAGIDGKELANAPENLKYTNASLNNNMRDKSPEEYIQWCEENPDKVNWNGKKGEPLPEDVKERLRKEYDSYNTSKERKIAMEYYTSPKFLGDTALVAGKRGVQMGVRQAMGFVFVEVWLAVKEKLHSLVNGLELKEMIEAVAQGVKQGFENAVKKYDKILEKLKEGVVAGAIASLTETICNIFFTTAKNIGKCIRQIYASVVEAGNILLFNPDKLPFGARIKAATVILATGASAIVGNVVMELVSKSPIAAIPVIGKIIPVFCGTLISGILSCTLLMFMDRSRFMNALINSLNRLSLEVNNYEEIATKMRELAAKLEEFDIEKFEMESKVYRELSYYIEDSRNGEELNKALMIAYEKLQIKLPWQGDFDEFMSDGNNTLIFE